MYSFLSATFAWAAARQLTGKKAEQQEERSRALGSSGGVGADSEQARHSFFADSHSQPLDQREYQFLLKSLNSSNGGITVLSLSSSLLKLSSVQSLGRV